VPRTLQASTGLSLWPWQGEALLSGEATPSPEARGNKSTALLSSEESTQQGGLKPCCRVLLQRKEKSTFRTEKKPPSICEDWKKTTFCLRRLEKKHLLSAKKGKIHL